MSKTDEYFRRIQVGVRLKNLRAMSLSEYAETVLKLGEEISNEELRQEGMEAYTSAKTPSQRVRAITKMCKGKFNGRKSLAGNMLDRAIITHLGWKNLAPTAKKFQDANGFDVDIAYGIVYLQCKSVKIASSRSDRMNGIGPGLWAVTMSYVGPTELRRFEMRGNRVYVPLTVWRLNHLHSHVVHCMDNLEADIRAANNQTNL